MLTRDSPVRRNVYQNTKTPKQIPSKSLFILSSSQPTTGLEKWIPKKTDKMATPLSLLPSHAVNSITTDEDDITWHDPPSSPFIDYVESDQENIAPLDITTTPTKPSAVEESIPISAIKHSSPVKGVGFKQRVSPVETFPKEQLVEEGEDVTLQRTFQERTSPKKASPMKDSRTSQPELGLSNSMQNRMPPSKVSQAESPAAEYSEPTLRENEGLTVAMKIFEETRSESHHESHNITRTDSHPESNVPIFEDLEFNPDATSMTIDDTCFSTFSEIPNMDMTKFDMMGNSPTKHSMLEQVRPWLWLFSGPLEMWLT